MTKTSPQPPRSPNQANSPRDTATTEKLFELFLGFSSSGYRVGWLLGGRKEEVHSGRTKPSGDRLARLFLTALIGTKWIRENLAFAGFPEKRFRLHFVTTGPEVLATIEAGSSSSSIISRIVKELLAEAEAFGEWTIESKPKDKP